MRFMRLWWIASPFAKKVELEKNEVSQKLVHLLIGARLPVGLVE